MAIMAEAMAARTSDQFAAKAIDTMRANIMNSKSIANLCNEYMLMTNLACGIAQSVEASEHRYEATTIDTNE